jgi:transposase
MTEVTTQGVLFPEFNRDERGKVFINGRCSIQRRDGFKVVTFAGMPIHYYAEGDRMSEAYAMVSLVEQGLASQKEVAQGFGFAARTVRRYQERFGEGGLAALGRSFGYPKGRPRLPATRARFLSKLKAEGHSNREIARRIGVTEKAVRKQLRRSGWEGEEKEQRSLPLGILPSADPNLSVCSTGSAESVVHEAGKPAPLPSDPADSNLSACAQGDAEDLLPTFDTDPSDRRFDRLMAYLGLLMDAPPLFQNSTSVPGAGVLFAIPAIVNSGVVECAREVYGSIGPAFFGLRTTMVCMVLMALLRLKRPEELKERSPQELGRIIGLDRAPEVKTLRRKLTRLAALGRSGDLGRSLFQCRAQAVGPALGFLYVDGHVRVYHGKRLIPKAHAARMRLPMPATTDYWVNDAKGDPLFVVTAKANAGLAKMLPLLLAEVRPVIGDRRVTVVFDRGGFSPKLFASLIAAGFDILTYRKGKTRKVPLHRFAWCEALIEGKKVEYQLADQNVLLLKRKLRLRQITRLTPTGHQTQILTSRRDLCAAEIAWRMFERWRQENFFKYLREEYAIDALVDYNIEPDDAEREVPNPHWLRLDAELRKARAETSVLLSKYGVEAFINDEEKRRTMRGFKIANAKIAKEIETAQRNCITLRKKRDATPRRVPVKQVAKQEVIKLATERKHITSLLKMVAYQAESDLLRIITPHYARAADEGRTLIQNILSSPADIEVNEQMLHIRLAPLSSAHRSRATAALCADLNKSKTRFPGTKLCLSFSVNLPDQP